MMRGDRLMRRIGWFQNGWFVLILTIPAYQASVRTHERLGVPLAWHHRVGLAVVSLLGVLGVLAVPGSILFAVLRLAESPTKRARRLRRRARRREQRADRVPRA